MVKERKLFFEKKTLKEAEKIWNKFLSSKNYPFTLGTETVKTENALNRVSADIVYSTQSSPFYTASAVDGIAVNSEKTTNASLSSPKILEIGRDGIMVNTGDPLSNKYNAVIMMENVEIRDKKFRILAPVQPYKNVRLIGEDIEIKETLLFPRDRITSAHIGVLLAGGIRKIKVYKKPRVLIIPTGEEIKKPGIRAKIGDIVDTNSYMFKSMIEEWGGEAIISEIQPNNVSKICRLLKENRDDFDIFLIEGGTAKGSKDFTRKVFEKCGKIFIHGISIQPGKPVLLGEILGKPAFGMPGFPVSSFIAGYLFLKPTIRTMQGLVPAKPVKIRATVKRPVTSSIGITEFVRVKVGKIEKETVAVPLKKGAGVLSSVSNADGFLKIDFDREGIEGGTRTEIEIFDSKKDMLNGILFIGSNDPLLNFLFAYTKEKGDSFNFGIVNSGSLGGLLAFERGECSITAVHLFDEKTETYNTPFLKKYLTKKYFTVRLSVREQGLIVRKGNPKNIKGIKDLTKKDIVFVNRQKGSGTRVITDYLLKKEGVSSKKIRGYEHEEYTHLAVANNIKLGGADCGMGIRYVADALGLDFIPIKKEPYDLVFLESERNRKEVKLLLKFMRDKNFIKVANKFKGYRYIGGTDNEETK